MPAACPDLAAPNSMWSFCPNIGAAYALTVLFGLITIFHLTQAVYYRKPYCWVIVAAGFLQTVCYIFRIISILNPVSYVDYAIWFVLLLVAPLFTNAFVYMVMGRMVWNYIEEKKLLGLSAKRFGLLFVVLDIIALAVQVYGAATAVGNNLTESQVLHALHTYMAGVGIQQFFILVFFSFAIMFHRRVTRSTTIRSSAKSPFALLYTLYAVLLLITMRIIFRLSEFAQGLTSTIPNHEEYQYGLDTLPMLLALVLLNAVHPGRIMAGTECDFPSKSKNNKHDTRSLATDTLRHVKAALWQGSLKQLASSKALRLAERAHSTSSSKALRNVRTILSKSHTLHFWDQKTPPWPEGSRLRKIVNGIQTDRPQSTLDAHKQAHSTHPENRSERRVPMMTSHHETRPVFKQAALEPEIAQGVPFLEGKDTSAFTSHQRCRGAELSMPKQHPEGPPFVYLILPFRTADFRTVPGSSRV